MAPGKSLNLRGGSISPSAKSYETSVIKVGGEIFDPDGYRMDVTVWFRHRNEALYFEFMSQLKPDRHGTSGSIGRLFRPSVLHGNLASIES
ncbi:unnamed protein product [Schistosoma mattheei]|uniref:Uncharacterized protein n=1 Tax=Schistosoma mattheei TaxID=31246 RepID=A0A183P0P3_9TREM|nr:unnamed protein product [Schistosoma mattheei]